MPTEPISIDLDSDVIEEACRRTAQRLRVALPASALTYDRDTSRMSAQPMVRFVAFNLEAKNEPAAGSLPVMHYSGGGYGVWFDIRPQDPAVLLACDGPVLGYYNDGQAVTPRYGQAHTYGCAVAFPGGRVSSATDPKPPPNLAGECLLGAADGSSSIAFRGAGITTDGELGSMVIATSGPTASLLLGGADAAIPVACATQVQANLVDLATRIAAWVPVLNDGGTSLKPVFLAWLNGLADMADAKARVQGPVAP